MRAVIAGAVAASVVGFLVIGIPALTTTAGCAAFGALVGAADRRGWSRRRTIATGVAILWPPIAAIAVLLLFVFSNLRKLTLDQIRNGWQGLFHLFENIGLDGVANAGDHAVEWIVAPLVDQHPDRAARAGRARHLDVAGPRHTGTAPRAQCVCGARCPNRRPRTTSRSRRSRCR